jgi:APA family basic amino acid/polyamine antiporter
VVNLTGLALLAVLVPLLVRGVTLSARATRVLVGITLSVLVLVIVVGSSYVDADNWSPFAPFGFDGIVSGASFVFFAFIGFDIVATCAGPSPTGRGRSACPGSRSSRRSRCCSPST